MSDHYPYFVSIRGSNIPNKENTTKLVKKEIHSQAAYDAFLNDLFVSEITSSLNQDPYADPNNNYDILHNHIAALKNKHIPSTYVKFNKYRHKGSKWITNGIIRSIKYKDKLYRESKCTNKNSPTYQEIKRKLCVYSQLLKKTIREAKVTYYASRFENYKSDIRKTWGVISQILNKKNTRSNGLKTIITEGLVIKDTQQIAK